jgi:predicted ATPase/DNA-binding SARP family transcriptional activator
VGTQGDGFFAVFSSAKAALRAVIEMQETLVSHEWPLGERVRVRMGLHSGEAEDTAAGLVGLEVHRAARVASAGHGGQILLSEAAAGLVRASLPSGVTLRDLGTHTLKGLAGADRIFQVDAPHQRVDFPPLASPSAAKASTSRAAGPLTCGMDIRLLGTLEVVDDSGALVPVAGAKLRALLAALAMRPGQVVSADRLVEELWGDDPPARGSNSLQVLVSKLRRALPPGVVVTKAPGYLLDVDAETVDVQRFAQFALRGRVALAAGDAEDAAGLFREALGLWRGEALAEFAFEEFAQAETARLDEGRLSVLEDRIDADLALGRHAEVVAELESLVRAEPLRERLHGQLMVALYRAGRQSDALRAYQGAREVLGEELGLEPSRELQQLEAMVLAHDAELDAPTRGPAVGPAGNLPAALSRFVGRRAELAHVSGVISATRLVTLTGPGGAGKTRLAVEVATAVRTQFLHGAWLVELADVADAAGVAPAVATTLGVTESAGPRSTAAAPSTVGAIAGHLTGRSLLVVLDNCEHVIDEAASVAEELLRSVPGLRVLATSREALAVPGESVVPVGPLALDDAVTLFADRGRAVAPGFVLLADEVEVATDVCRRLDGMPLAIELAAARLRAFPLGVLAARLDDRFRILTSGARTAEPRHKTLRAVVEWSHSLLFPDEQRLFSRLSVFAGSFTLEDLEAVCADDELAAVDVVDLLLRLIDKSLVAAAPAAGNEARYSQLQTLREYGRERLAESGEAHAMGERHAVYYRRMGEEAREGLRGAAGPRWRARLNGEIGNLRAALDWHISEDDAEGALSLTTGMAWLWFVNGEFLEAARWLADALGAAGLARPEARAIGHAWHGYFTTMSADPRAGVAECEAAVAELRASGDLTVRLEGLLLCAASLSNARVLARSLDVLDEAGEVLKRVDHSWLSATRDILRAFNLAPLGRLDEAEAAARSSLEGFEALGEVWFTMDPLSVLAEIADARGDLAQAASGYEAVLERSRAAGQQDFVPFRVLRLAALRARQGDDEAACRLYEEALASSTIPWHSAEARVGQAAVVRRLGDLRRARVLLEAAGEQFDALDLPSGRAIVRCALAWWALGAGEDENAEVFASEAAAVEKASGDSTLQQDVKRVVAAVNAVAHPSPENVAAFLALTQQAKGKTPAFDGVTDEPDVKALAAWLSGAQSTACGSVQAPMRSRCPGS